MSTNPEHAALFTDVFRGVVAYGAGDGPIGGDMPQFGSIEEGSDIEIIYAATVVPPSVTRVQFHTPNKLGITARVERFTSHGGALTMESALSYSNVEPASTAERYRQVIEGVELEPKDIGLIGAALQTLRKDLDAFTAY